MFILPIITFLQDVFAMTKGPYHRKVGRHTQKFCSRAVKRSGNEIQKKIFFIAAICADEFIASLLGVDNKRQVGPLAVRTFKPKIRKPEISTALRIYMSALLTVISLEKKLLLERTGMEENELLKTWCAVFEYLPSDMKLFDEVMLPNYQEGGIESLSALVGKEIVRQLCLDHDALTPLEMKILQNIIIEDAAALMGLLQKDIWEAI